MSTDGERDNDFERVLGEEYSLLRHAYPHHDEFQSAVSRVLANHFRGSRVAELRVLEGGIGSGVTTSFLLQADSRIRVTGVDNSMGVLKQIPELLGEDAVRVKPVLSDLLDYVWNCPDNSFDAFVSVWTLHNLQPAYRDSLLVEIKRVLRPDGIIILGDKFAVDDEKEHGKQLAAQLERFNKFKANKQLAQKWMAHNEVDDYIKLTESEQLDVLGDLGFDMVCVSYREKMEAVISATESGKLLVLAPDSRDINVESVGGGFVAVISPPVPEEPSLPAALPDAVEADGEAEEPIVEEVVEPEDHIVEEVAEPEADTPPGKPVAAMSVSEAVAAFVPEEAERGPAFEEPAEKSGRESEDKEPVKTIEEIIAEFNALAEDPTPHRYEELASTIGLNDPEDAEVLSGPAEDAEVLSGPAEDAGDELAYEGGETDQAPPSNEAVADIEAHEVDEDHPEIPPTVVEVEETVSDVTEPREPGPQVILARGNAVEDVAAEDIADPDAELVVEELADEEEKDMVTVAAETREAIRRRRADAQAEKITDFEEFERLYGPF